MLQALEFGRFGASSIINSAVPKKLLRMCPILESWSLVPLCFSQMTDIIAVYGTSNALIIQTNDITSPRFHDNEAKIHLSHLNGRGGVGGRGC
jgi:hypothetical protein